MCDPTGGIATLALVTSTALAAGSSVAGGNAEKSLAYSQASSDEAQGRNELMASSERAQRIRMQGQRFLANQRVDIAAGGIEAGSGSSLEVGKADAAEIELDALTELFGGQTRKKMLDQQAMMTRATGKTQQKIGYVKGASDILGTVAKWPGLG